jgi:alkylation response protein AidB-like acyl-CoA dehydrogenase
VTSAAIAGRENLRQRARKLAKDKIAPLAGEMERTGVPSAALCDLYREEGWLDAFVPAEFGGTQFSGEDWYLLNEEVARVSVASALLMEFGSTAAVQFAPAEQHARLFPHVVGKVSAFAATEPDAGSDILALRTHVADKGGHYLLNGQKCLINNGGIAEVITVVATVEPGSGRSGIRVLLVDPAAPGVRRSAERQKMGLRGASLADLSFDNVEIPATHLIGGEDGYGILKRLICHSRTTVSAMAIGNAQAAMERSLEHCLHRKQFGRPVYDNQAVSFMIADMAIGIEAARDLALHAVRSLEAGEEEAPLLAMKAKVFATNNGARVTADAVQCLGGGGYLQENTVERRMRDATALQITVGTNQMHQKSIARVLAKQCLAAGPMEV